MKPGQETYGRYKAGKTSEKHPEFGKLVSDLAALI